MSYHFQTNSNATLLLIWSVVASKQIGDVPDGWIDRCLCEDQVLLDERVFTAGFGEPPNEWYFGYHRDILENGNTSTSSPRETKSDVRIELGNISKLQIA